MLTSKLQTALRACRNRGVLGLGWTIMQSILKRRFIDLSDEYIDWLCYANAGLLARGNLYCFDYAIGNLPPNAPIVELGSFCGLSTNILTYYKEKHGIRNKLITCDPWAFSGKEKDRRVGRSTISFAEYCAFVKDTYRRNVRMFSRYDLPYTVEMSSDEFFSAWRESRATSEIFGRSITLGGPIGFCYVDGDHSYECVRRDFQNCDDFLVSGGFVLFDDSSDFQRWDGVRRVVAEVGRSARYELLIKNPNYFFRKK